MAKDRVSVCKNYICAGICKKGRKAEYSGYCQRCDKYEPRGKVKHDNKKKSKLEKVKRKEAKED